MNNKTFFIVIMLMAMSMTAFGQRKFSKITAADFATPAEAADTTVDAVFIYEIGETKFTASSVRFTMDTYVKTRVHILTEEGREYANKTLTYRYNTKNNSNENDRIEDVEAAAYNLVNGKVVKTSMPGKYVFKEKVNDNYMRLKFTVPDVKVGTIIEYSYMISTPRCTELPTWYIQKNEPVRYSYYSATIPEWYNYHIESRGYKAIKGESTPATIHLPTFGAAAIEAKKYVIEAENLRPFKGENFIFCKADYMQRVILSL